MISFYKTKQGSWAVKGREYEVSVGPVTVVKKDGTTTEFEVEDIGTPFRGTDGKMYVIGYGASNNSRRGGSGYYGSAHEQKVYCDECGERAWPGSICPEMGFEH